MSCLKFKKNTPITVVVFQRGQVEASAGEKPGVCCTGRTSVIPTGIPLGILEGRVCPHVATSLLWRSLSVPAEGGAAASKLSAGLFPCAVPHPEGFRRGGEAWVPGTPSNSSPAQTFLFTVRNPPSLRGNCCLFLLYPWMGARACSYWHSLPMDAFFLVRETSKFCILKGNLRCFAWSLLCFR